VTDAAYGLARVVVECSGKKISLKSVLSSSLSQNFIIFGQLIGENNYWGIAPCSPIVYAMPQFPVPCQEIAQLFFIDMRRLWYGGEWLDDGFH